MGFALHRARHLAPGDRLGKFELIRQIAVGGMAELYLARTVGIEGFEKLVVVKRILPQYAANATFVNMFLGEARLAATLQHPNIAQVYEIGQDQGEYFFSMEYVHGQDLGQLLASATENGVPVSLDAAITLVCGMCAGLHHAHDKLGPDGQLLGVVHRDVSPSNVLVGYDGGVKVVDFGIARVAVSTPGIQLKGKVAYMSPEQGRGKVALDRRSDLFSVGTILYELTTGQLPFVDETEYGVLSQIVNRDADPPSTIVPGYPPALEAIVMRALARDPDRRYATALELQTQLDDFAHENRLRASPLVLARLMSTLFPARLEEWDHARAQGAFFVEQHVVRTLEENKTMEPPTVSRRAPEMVDDAPTSTRVPTPIPASGSHATTIPMMLPPSAVPTYVPSAASRGTLVSNQGPGDARHPLFGTGGTYEVTERVRVPNDATMLVSTRRTHAPVVILAMLGAAVAAAVTYFALAANDAPPTPAAAVEPAARSPNAAAKPAPATQPAVQAPTSDDAPAVNAAAALPSDPARPDAAPVTGVRDAGDARPSDDRPASKKRSRRRGARTKPEARTDAKADAKKPARPGKTDDTPDKPDKPDKTDWTDDSPFMPVRPEKAP